MKLIGSLTSPYVRKVRVVMAEKKLDYQLELENVWSPDSQVQKYNPLGKVPCLVMEDGGALFEAPDQDAPGAQGRRSGGARRWRTPRPRRPEPGRPSGASVHAQGIAGPRHSAPQRQRAEPARRSAWRPGRPQARTGKQAIVLDLAGPDGPAGFRLAA
ncbi:glutathione S-transferase, N-terminal domain protein [Bordetella bronchiseptica A1-7]|nr:glutathione S-transferase, N-terminal domain protein [Bordetella bronchiseptica A1-7]